MSRNLSRIDAGAIALLGAIAERPDAQISRTALEHHAGAAGKRLIEAGLLARTGGVAAAVSMSDHADEAVTLIPSPVDGVIGYFSPGSGWVTPSAGEAAVYRIRFDALFVALLADLDCSHVARPRELVRGLVWGVGMARIPGRAARVDVWIARRLSHPAGWQAFSDLTKARPSPGLRLVLSLTPDHGIPRQFTQGHEIVGVDAVLDHDAGLKIDPEILAARLAHLHDDEDPISISADGAIVTVRGRRYRFTGGKQRAIIRRLYAAWKAGSPECLTAEILENAGCGLKVNTLAKAFSKRDDWRDFICEEGGRCWIFL